MDNIEQPRNSCNNIGLGQKRPPSVLLFHNSTAPPSPAPPFSSSTFVGATHLSLTTISPPLSPSVLISHNPVDTWVSTTSEAPNSRGRTTPLEWLP
ncbi:hypothetical protein ACB098_10G072400 [Castanea mollissima]